jgi:hypothetical protein
MENEQQDQVLNAEVITTLDALSTIVKADIDIQISTAKNYPRSLTKFMKELERIGTLTVPIAESCSYGLPRKQKNETTGRFETKVITGPSVRFAEIVCATYGNIRSGARVISNDGKFITAQGFCHDLETNNFIAIEYKRKITDRNGRTYSEDMQGVTGNAACAIAFRNAVFKVIPAAIVAEPYEKIKEVAKGDAATLETRRQKAVNFFTQRGVDEKRIFTALNVDGMKDIDLDKLAELSAMKAAFANQEVTSLEDLFPAPDNQDKSDKTNGKTMDLMEGSKKKKAEKTDATDEEKK